ncbi:GDYXXLXY domain-containing protein [Sphingobacterium oryzagri]|uniref:GDYXXLXY domain-containing protein n=1 Tax=Sphingobacterium oryzagri TaxID=3025669 RepID=A0ABY7WG43_9SPHI|nr:GDYXXLXY domain-containing protein [Sphingobacterium sp. KACC 22765]WDF67584.1 GDYXXLXY domain-containing protein [Sphingobacterium sp. KACC 22765]
MNNIKKYKGAIIVLNLLLLLAYFNNSIFQKEKILADGQLILLQLAPVDPRSLMQGDYMQLRYAITEGIRPDSVGRRGYCVLRVLPDNTTQRIRFQQTATPLAKDERLLAYTSPGNWSIELGAESYFFQEGHAQKYENAKYGGLMIDGKGNSLLVGLYDNNLKKIE